MIVITVLAILALGCCGSTLAVDCTNKEALQREQLKCFTSQGLEVNVDVKELQNSVQNNPDLVCRQKDKYKQALKCALNIARRCMLQLGQDATIIPDPDRASQGMDYICNNRDNINSTCVQQKNAALQVCVINKAQSAFTGSDLDVKKITCKAFQLTVECLEEVLTECPGQTKTVIVHYTQTYLTPPACGQDQSQAGGFTPTTTTPTTTMTPVSAFTLVTGMPSLPYASCYSQDSIQTAQHRCYRNEGLEVVMPEITLGNGRKTKQSYLDALMSNSRDFKVMCRNQLGQYQRAMWCAMEVARNCMPSGYKNYVPSGRQVQELLVDLCNNVDDIDQKCVNSKASALFDCGYRKGQTLRGKDTKALLCSAFKFNAVCQKEELYPCGCKTSSLYIQMSKAHLNPTACPPIDVTPYPCNRTTGDYTGSDHYRWNSNAAAAHSTVSGGLLAVLSAVLAVRRSLL